VQGSKIAELIEALVDRIVETNGLTELASSVHDPMADGRDLWGGGEEPAQRLLQVVVGDGGQIIASLQVLGIVEEPELEAARARVDDEDVHRVSLVVSSGACHPSRPARDAALMAPPAGRPAQATG
jgi:hypothetical protein